MRSRSRRSADIDRRQHVQRAAGSGRRDRHRDHLRAARAELRDLLAERRPVRAGWSSRPRCCRSGRASPIEGFGPGAAGRASEVKVRRAPCCRRARRPTRSRSSCKRRRRTGATMSTGRIDRSTCAAPGAWRSKSRGSTGTQSVARRLLYSRRTKKQVPTNSRSCRGQGCRRLPLGDCEPRDSNEP